MINMKGLPLLEDDDCLSGFNTAKCVVELYACTIQNILLYRFVVEYVECVWDWTHKKV